jgi:hypothetical protein
MGLEKQALAELEKAARLSGNSPLYLAQVEVAHVSAGRKTEALMKLERLCREYSKYYGSPYELRKSISK